MNRHERKALEPGALPPNPSVGELVTEIDRARHDAAHTLGALVDRLDPRPAVLARSRQITEVAPAPIATALTGISRTTQRMPTRVRVAVALAPVLLMLWLRHRRKS